MVRVAGLNDAPSLAHLRYQWRTVERSERGLDEASFAVALRAWMVANSATHTPFLALDGDEPVGMGWLAIVNRVPGPEVFVRRSAYVQSVYVVERLRSRGVGGALMAFILDHAKGLDLDYLVVHPSDRARSLYRRLGFLETDRVLELRE